MRKMILHPTPTAQWQALINEASLALGRDALPETLESYLVFLLMRFMGCPQLTSSVVAIEFLESLEKLKFARESALQGVGDKCLLLAGFFPELAKRRRVRVSYYIEIGQSAYANLSSVHHQALSALFAQLSHEFVQLVDILHSMRSLDTQRDSMDLLTAEELWRDTKSQQAWQLLEKRLKHCHPAIFVGERSQEKH